MIELTNHPRGNLVTICNYDFYQNPNNYESTSESTNESTSGQPVVNQQPPAINKNVKNERMKEEPKEPSSSADEVEFYLTKKGKKLTGKRLETFKMFWSAFNYKTGKAEAADAWYQIPALTDAIVEKIIAAAKKEAEARPSMVIQGKTPKMAQGWISGRRWEDEQPKESIVKRQKQEYDPRIHGSC